MAKKKQVRSMKGPAPKPTNTIQLGNVSVLTVKLLDQIVQELQGLRKDIKDNV